MAYREMRNYGGLVTFWDLYERAARAKYGDNILIFRNSSYEKMVNDIPFRMSIIEKERVPREATRTIVDITTKEYTNNGVEKDETVLKITKQSLKHTENTYSFSSTRGVDVGFGDRIGTTLMNMSIAGVSTIYTRNKSKTTGFEIPGQQGFAVSYEREEKIIIPPGKRVTVKVISYRVKYMMNYTLKFTVNTFSSVPLKYQSGCQQGCLGNCHSKGSVLPRDMISTLPNYCTEDEHPSFTQSGTLFWFGEASSVEKVEEPLNS